MRGGRERERRGGEGRAGRGTGGRNKEINQDSQLQNT